MCTPDTSSSQATAAKRSITDECKYHLSRNEVPRRRITVNSQQRSVVAPRHETKRYLVFGGRQWRMNLKHCNAAPIVAAVPVAFRFCRSTCVKQLSTCFKVCDEWQSCQLLFQTLSIFISRHDPWCKVIWPRIACYCIIATRCKLQYAIYEMHRIWD